MRRFITTWLVLLCQLSLSTSLLSQTAGTSPLISVDRPPPPPSLEGMALDVELVVWARITDARSDDYQRSRLPGSPALPTMSTSAYSLQILEVFKDTAAGVLGPVERRITVRTPGYLPSSKRGLVDPDFPELVPQREYVMFLLRRPPRGTVWFAYGAGGVFRRSGEVVETVGTSALARSLKGTDWTRFLVQVRQAARQSKTRKIP